MDIQQALKYALEGEAIPFAGSGFFYGAKNIMSHSLLEQN